MAATLALASVSGLNCPKVGGVKALYVIPASDISSLTFGSDHDVTDIVFGSVGVGFGKIEFKRGECEVTESMERSNQVNVTFAVPNPTSTQRKEMEAIRNNCELNVVAELYDSERFLYIGNDNVYQEEAFARVTTTESTSGKAKEDDNLFAVTMSAEQGEYLRVLSGISGATTPATTAAQIRAELIAATSV